VRCARRLVPLTLALALGLSAPAAAVHKPWPPPPREGTLFAHLGEEHWDDPDGPRIFPKVIEESIRYRPAAVLTSADKTSDGTVDKLQTWRDYMEAYDRAGIPYYAAVGNHDRQAKPGFLKGTDPTASLANYQRVFSGRPYPFGDATPVQAPGFAPRTRPSGDPPGASSSYAVDVGPARWIFLDNSCFSFLVCDPLQNPPFPNAEGDRSQMDFLRRTATEAEAQGRRAFVVMHMPTQDPRPGHTEPTPAPHTMGEGVSPENGWFERLAAQLGIDGVFAGHVKGMWRYGAGGVPFFTDGGAGGEVYVGPGEQTGVDYGYWHGYRLVHVDPGGGVTTDAVPIFRPGALDVDGPGRVARGSTVRWSARGDQLTEEGAQVTLELREPSAARPNRANLPTPAFMWTTSNAEILRPVPGDDEDPRRVAGRQTSSGRFEAVCPGRAAIVVGAGWEGKARVVTVTSRPGRLVGSIRPLTRRVERGRSTPLARIRLAQPARVHVRIRRGGRTIRTLQRTCQSGGGNVTVAWNGNGRTRTAALGRYTVDVRVRSEREPVVRRFTVRTRR